MFGNGSQDWSVIALLWQQVEIVELFRFGQLFVKSDETSAYPFGQVCILIIASIARQPTSWAGVSVAGRPTL